MEKFIVWGRFPGSLVFEMSCWISILAVWSDHERGKSFIAELSLNLKTWFFVQVDLAVIEVGIGGAYDCTNIIR